MGNQDSVLGIAQTFLKVIIKPPFRFGTQLMDGIPKKLWLRFWKEWDQLQVCISTLHSSEIRGLCLMKRPIETLQNLPYFIYY